jgi:hypothetical protein
VLARDGGCGMLVQVLGDFMRILLEVINCILSLNLGRNPELVYALLHKQEVFEQLRPHAGFSELIENLQVRHQAAVSAPARTAHPVQCCAVLQGDVTCSHCLTSTCQHCRVQR